jgi:hypothetical protein
MRYGIGREPAVSENILMKILFNRIPIEYNNPIIEPIYK